MTARYWRITMTKERNGKAVCFPVVMLVATLEDHSQQSAISEAERQARWDVTMEPKGTTYRATVKEMK